jgi:hypothetical protein
VISELQQVLSNIKTNHTYTNTANYWAPPPLIDDNNDDDDGDIEEEINNINDAAAQRDFKITL